MHQAINQVWPDVVKRLVQVRPLLFALTQTCNSRLCVRSWLLMRLGRRHWMTCRRPTRQPAYKHSWRRCCSMC